MQTALRIGKHIVGHYGGHWFVADRHGIISKHDAKFEAVRAAKRYNWLEQNKPAGPSDQLGTGGNDAESNPSGERRVR